MIGRVCVAVAVLLTVFFFGHESRAQARDPAAADALFRAGREAMSRGDCKSAILRFQESSRLDPSPGALLNQAICEEQIGRLTGAWHDYRRVLELLPDTDGRVRIATRRLETLEKRLSWLTIQIAAQAPRDTRIARGNVELGRASVGIALPFDPGRHELTVAAPRHRPRLYIVNLSEGERETLVVSPGAIEPRAALAAPAKTASTSRPVAHQRDAPPTAAYALLAVGAAGITAAGVTGILLLDRLATVNEHCENKQCDEIGLEAARSGRTLRATAAVALTVGVISAGVGGYLLVTSDGDKKEIAWRHSF